LSIGAAPKLQTAQTRNRELRWRFNSKFRPQAPRRLKLAYGLRGGARTPAQAVTVVSFSVRFIMFEYYLNIIQTYSKIINRYVRSYEINYLVDLFEISWAYFGMK